MLPVYPISDEAKAYIQQKLQEIAREHDVRILLAVESGSRAWGFPSTDSDYDVRFIYAHATAAYLSVKEYRDVIETPTMHDNFLGVPLDLNGWDLRKALQLGIKSNPVLIEWLVSPIRYAASGAAADILDFSKQTANIQAIRYHYDRLARNAWEQILQSANEVKVKLYCYALRPVLSVQWILQYNEPPPMDMLSLCKGLISDAVLEKEISGLIDLKSGAKEGDMITRSSVLDSMINTVLEDKAERPVESVQDEMVLIYKADQLFLKLVG